MNTIYIQTIGKLCYKVSQSTNNAVTMYVCKIITLPQGDFAKRGRTKLRLGILCGVDRDVVQYCLSVGKHT